jgi:hypothetical protein
MQAPTIGGLRSPPLNASVLPHDQNGKRSTVDR